MVGIIVSGHGNFASGLLSTLKLIAGEQENVVGIDFIDGQGFEDEVFILTDLAGGSPFTNSVLLKQELTDKNIEVISGTNIPMLLEVVLGRDNVELKDLIKTATEAGTKGINIFELKEKQHEDDNLDDGI